MGKHVLITAKTKSDFRNTVSFLFRFLFLKRTNSEGDLQRQEKS